METLPFEIYHHEACFLDAPSLLTATLLSKTFFHAVDDHELWKRAALSYFPEAEEADVEPYLHDWCALVCDGNRKTKNTVLLDTFLFIQDEDMGRIYTRWMPLVGHHPETRIRLIVDPRGFAQESFNSVYLEAVTKEDITLSFRITPGGYLFETFCARDHVCTRTGAFPNYSSVFPHENFFSNIF